MDDICKSQIKDWMSEITCTIDREQSVREALDLLGQHRISALPVVNSAHKPIGILTIGDFMHAIDQTGNALDESYPHFDDCLWAVDMIQRRLGSDKVYSLMSEVLTTVEPTQTMRAAAKIMCEAGLHHLLVCNEDQTLAGMLSASDFVRLVDRTTLA